MIIIIIMSYMHMFAATAASMLIITIEQLRNSIGTVHQSRRPKYAGMHVLGVRVCSIW